MKLKEPTGKARNSYSMYCTGMTVELASLTGFESFDLEERKKGFSDKTNVCKRKNCKYFGTKSCVSFVSLRLEQYNFVFLSFFLFIFWQICVCYEALVML